jgi:hypothetical protein
MQFLATLVMVVGFLGGVRAGIMGMEDMRVERDLEIRFPGYLAARAMLTQADLAIKRNAKRATTIPVCLPCCIP